MNIETDRLILRSVTEDDLEAFHRLQSDAQVTRWTKQGPNKTIKRSEQMLDALLVLVNTSSQQQPIIIQAITVRPSWELVGLVGTFRSREIGFSLHPDQWSKGYAQEATKAFCAWYMRSYLGHALFAKVNVENTASVKCLTRCGFTPATEEEQLADGAYEKDTERETWIFRNDQ